MKHLFNLLLILCPFLFFSCQEDEDVARSGGVGYLRLNIAASSEMTTKAYDAEQFQVIITNTETNKVAYQTEDASKAIAADEAEAIELPAGTYKIEAKSYNYEGVEAIPGADRPYYAGLTEGVVVTAGKSTDASVECKLANVKVTVNFSQELVSAFAGRTVSASVKGGNFTAETFTPEKSGAEHSTYFPIVDLVTTFSVNNPSNAAEPYTKEQEIKEVAGNTHYVITYQLELEGTGSFEVTYDQTYNQYNFTVPVNPGAAVGAMMTASAWDRLAYLKAENIATSSGTSLEGLKFQYRTVASAEENEDAAWTEVVATAADEKYTAFATGLTAETEYEYRLVNGAGDEIAPKQKFTTGKKDAETPLTDGGFDSWTTDGEGIIYPGASTSALFWDTSNKGANTMSMLTGITNPTSGVSSPKIAGDNAAQLKSASVWGFFAAASLYTGSFGEVSGTTATVNFGQSYTSRPIALKGYYQYTPAKLPENAGDKLPEDATVVAGGDDQCSIYVILSTKKVSVDNGEKTTLLTPKKIFDGDEFIAYGDLSDATIKEPTDQTNGYSEFTIPLKYKEGKLSTQPTHIIVVCSSSKYGDYMTGGVGSTLLVDEFSLVYEGTPAIWNFESGAAEE